MKLGETVYNTDEFKDFDIIVDGGNLPWRYFEGYWKSYYSSENSGILGHILDVDPFAVRLYGLTTHQLFVDKKNYGPFTLIWRKPSKIDGHVHTPYCGCPAGVRDTNGNI